MNESFFYKSWRESNKNNRITKKKNITKQKRASPENRCRVLFCFFSILVFHFFPISAFFLFSIFCSFVFVLLFPSPSFLFFTFAALCRRRVSPLREWTRARVNYRLDKTRLLLEALFFHSRAKQKPTSKRLFLSRFFFPPPLLLLLLFCCSLRQ